MRQRPAESGTINKTVIKIQPLLVNNNVSRARGDCFAWYCTMTLLPCLWMKKSNRYARVVWGS
jgi:hypothetical protein